MRKWISFSLAVCLGTALAGIRAAQAQQASPPPRPQAESSSAGPVLTVNEAIDRVIAREHAEEGTIRRYDPVIETYIQEMRPDRDLGSVPVRDDYYLGQADLAKGVVDENMLGTDRKSLLQQLNPLTHVMNFFSYGGFDPAGFLQMVYLDPVDFDRAHYHFEYIGKDFLGSVRCYIFDLTPLPKSGRGRFRGRIWVEDQDFTIIRFNGGYTPTSGIHGYGMHFDSWRLNLQPNLWLPTYIYSQESSVRDLMGNHIRFKAQTRLWGYDLKNASHEQTFSQLTIESPDAVQDQNTGVQDRSPVEEERQWQQHAEQNVLDRLQRDGLLSPPSPVDKVLDTEVNNLEVTNNLDIEPEVHCRVLLTSTLESFSIGHTIVLSRGLIDVLPDEDSLAAVIAQDLADIMITRPSTDQYGFNDVTDVNAMQVLRDFSFRDTPDDVIAAGQKAVELLKKYPSKDHLAGAALFFKQLSQQQKFLPALINPRIGNGVYLDPAFLNSGPQLKPLSVDQISALPLGARIKMNPWTDQVEMLNAKAVPLYSAREKMPFQITPFYPFVSRYQTADSSAAGAATDASANPGPQSAPAQTPSSQASTAQPQ
ncbi:MAG TPA: hypothetical protein VNK23_03265 [Candidatus Dormibacteraeota bacterium]|nr:hypothetical protein [Candidatus Dormibacteraeota bacterium]